MATDTDEFNSEPAGNPALTAVHVTGTRRMERLMARKLATALALLYN
ncbi:MAG: hypothetical protein IT423_22285 [Pirellulaceae bacterium]|nr:hypothetical protein [Pirellulaceae bacterium]